jgi:hypothetical protein
MSNRTTPRNFLKFSKQISFTMRYSMFRMAVNNYSIIIFCDLKLCFFTMNVERAGFREILVSNSILHISWPRKSTFNILEI